MFLSYHVFFFQVPDDYVIVSKNDLAQLATEIAQLKQVLPKVLTKDLVKVVGKLPILEEGKLRDLDICQKTAILLHNIKHTPGHVVQLVMCQICV